MARWGCAPEKGVFATPNGEKLEGETILLAFLRLSLLPSVFAFGVRPGA